jgi:hypothetical protein
LPPNKAGRQAGRQQQLVLTCVLLTVHGYSFRISKARFLVEFEQALIRCSDRLFCFTFSFGFEILREWLLLLMVE